MSAVMPCRFNDSFTEIWMKVWFEELPDPVVFLSSPFDRERHGKELWIRVMAGEFGPIEIIERKVAIGGPRRAVEAPALRLTYQPKA